MPTTLTRPHAGRLRRLLVAAAVAATPLALPTAALAAPSGSAHQIPYSQSTGGVTMLCFDGSGFTCTAGGYDGTAGQIGGNGWATWQYWQHGSGGTQKHNCTTYAAYRLQQNGVAYPGWTDDANGWDTQAWNRGTPVDQTPAVGAIAQWNGGQAGHVAYVEAVTSTYVEMTSDNYGLGTNRFRVANGSAYLPDNYVHYKDVGGVLADGSFVNDTSDGRVYRIAGGAPVYVSTWDAFGGPQPTSAVTHEQLLGLRAVPADGTFVTTQQDGRVYRVAGGAPVYVSTWDAFGGPQPTTGIDQWAVDNAGNPFSHLLPAPADGTFVSTTQDGAVYRVAGGAPVYVSTFDAYGGPQPSVGIDKWAVDNAGNPASHLRPLPADGTLVNTAQDGRVYRVVGGAPTYVSSFDHIGGPQPSTTLDKWAVDNAGNPASHLRPFPLDGTFVNTSPDGKVYRVAGGKPFYVGSWSSYGGQQPSTTIDQWAVDNAADPAAHLRTSPVDGTRLVGIPSGQHWTVTSGQRAATAASAGAVGIEDASIAGVPQATQPSPGPTPPPSPGPSPPPSGSDVAPTLTLSPATISAGQRVTVTYRGTPGSTIQVLSRTQPATAFSRITTVTLDADGHGTSSHAPQKNTRMTATSATGLPSPDQPIIAVRSVASLNAQRLSTRTYRFTGRVYPARDQRLVSLYRNGVLLAQTRTGPDGIYTLTKTLAAGTFTFHTKTSDDTYNLGTLSPARRFTVS